MLADERVRGWAAAMRDVHYARWSEAPLAEIVREFGPEYAENFGQYVDSETARRLLSWGYAWPGARVLDCGCGRGLAVATLAEAGVAVYGIDVNASLIATSLAPGRCQVGDIRALPFAERAFDLAYSIDVLEHLVDYDRAVEEADSLWEDPTHVVFLDVAGWRLALARRARILGETTPGGFLIEAA